MGPMTRSSFYKERELSETLMMRSQGYFKIQCPHCLRKFCRKAGERHIPVCNKIFSKPKPLFRNKDRQFLPSLTKIKPNGDDLERDRNHSVKPKARILYEDQSRSRKNIIFNKDNLSHSPSTSHLEKSYIKNSVVLNEGRNKTINLKGTNARRSFNMRKKTNKSFQPQPRQ